MPQISVIVPVYNVGLYVEQCIKSIRNQTFRDIEIILVNDGSTDASGEICRHYEQADHRILYIETENRGVAKARNTGMEKAEGEWLCFVDGDDYLPDGALEKLLGKSEGADVVVGNYFTDRNGTVRQEKFFSDNIPETDKKGLVFLLGNALGSPFYGAAYTANIGVPWAKLYRREFCRKLGVYYPVLKRMQDTAFNIMVFRNTKRISFVEEAVYYYRFVEDSAIHRYNPDFRDIADDILKWMEGPIKNNPDTYISSLYDFKLLSLVLETIKLSYIHPQCGLNTSEKIKRIRVLCEGKSVGDIFAGSNRRLFSRKQRLLLMLLSKKLYGVFYYLYFLKLCFKR